MICFLCWRCHNGHIIGCDKSFSVFSLFSLISNRCCMWQFFFGSCQVITFAYRFGKMVPFTAIMDAISLWFSAMDNALLCASGLYPKDKIEEWITFALCHARLYLTVSYDDWDDKSAAANTFDISCWGGVSISSLPSINVSVLATSDVVGCWLFPSAWFLSNNPPYHHFIVDHLIETELMGIINNQLNRK